MLTECHFRAVDGITCYKKNAKWGDKLLWRINSQLGSWIDGKADPSVKTQPVGPTWASCHCVKVTFNLVPRWANIVMNMFVVRSPNMQPTCWSNHRPMSKITLGQHRRTTLCRYNERWTTNTGPTLSCYLLKDRGRDLCKYTVSK